LRVRAYNFIITLYKQNQNILYDQIYQTKRRTELKQELKFSLIDYYLKGLMNNCLLWYNLFTRHPPPRIASLAPWLGGSILLALRYPEIRDGVAWSIYNSAWLDLYINNRKLSIILAVTGIYTLGLYFHQ